MNLIRVLRSRELVVFVILLVLMVVIGLVNPTFLQIDSILNMANSSLILIIIGIGEMFVVLTHGIDVSVGAIMGLSAVILGTFLNKGVPLPVCIVFAILTGLAAGMVNGFGVTILRVPPIIMTLGTLGAYRGLMQIITGGSWIETIPQSIKSMTGMSFLGISVFAWLTLVLAVVVTLLLKRIKRARYFYAIGDNELGAYLMGVPVKTTRFLAYSLAGGFAGIASIIFVSHIGFIPMATGDGQEMRAIAAIVLGGVNLAGGVGAPVAAVVGGLFLTVIDSIMVYLKLPAEWNNAIAGAMLLVVVLIDYRIRLSVEARQRHARAQSRLGLSAAVQGQQSIAAKEAR